MPYDANATSNLNFKQENLVDFQSAQPGQWFIGVIDTSKKEVFIVPVNVFEGRGGVLNQQTLSNDSPRGMNRYASGTPEDKNGDPEVRRKKYENFQTFKNGNWLENRAAGVTHHTGVALHYQSDPADCLGFSLIKVAVGGFAQLKCSSNSLNGDKPETSLNVNFSQKTHNTLHNREGSTTGSFQMPDVWIQSLEDFLKRAPFGIINLVKSNE